MDQPHRQLKYAIPSLLIDLSTLNNLHKKEIILSFSIYKNSETERMNLFYFTGTVEGVRGWSNNWTTVSLAETKIRIQYAEFA